MAPESNPKLDKLAKEFRIARDAWMELKPDMDKAREKLEVNMQAAGVERYETKDGYEVEMVRGEAKVKVRKKKDGDE